MKLKLCLAIVVCLSAIGYQSVQAVNCTKGSTTDCVASDFTSANCVGGQCSCKDTVNFLIIPTGCAEKLKKPQVTYAPGRTREFLVGQSPPTLTCLTTETDVQFSWEKDGTVMGGANSVNYTFPNSTAVGAGSYVCAITDGLEIVKSDPVSFTAIPTNAGPTTPPVVDGIPTSAASGARITPLCTGIPLGATYQFQLTLGPSKGTPTDIVTQSDADMGEITCKINNTVDTINATSVPKPWNPTVVADIEVATVTITAATVTSSSAVTQYFNAGTTVTATCVTTPESQFVVVGTAPATNIAYVFTDSANTAAAPTGNTYTVTPANGTHTITCYAAYGGKANKTSAAVTVTFNSSITAPVLASDPKPAVVSLGSRLFLTCGDDKKAQGVTYTWTKDNKPISRQRDRIIQYSKFTQADAGKYVCTAILTPATVVSNTVDVKAAANSLHVLGSTLLLALVALANSKIL
jgi:hypothetical protein